ncbi:hypothetical protein M1247_32300 [Mycobacterium sp. 21AC1]|uniref:hypothetical protein n=1 Tax=[Mycobacterium] appelbergii TaxID=2939269 RepID=UPI002938DDC0|nr:hypothetical protein [Mycobacterium sp. 21AC1]MDV3129625.1 hypothetical protein [Mycobacterium sp. 21AC1]
MKRTVAAVFLLMVLVEAYAVTLADRRVVAWAAGAMVAVLLAAVRWSLHHEGRPDTALTEQDDAAELLAQWMSQTETLVGRADSTRAQWDRHLRPRLAREFAAATGHRQTGDSVAFKATGRMLFGPDLWQWVDPDNVTYAGVETAGGDTPGPGREVLGEILQRLERL